MKVRVLVLTVVLNMSMAVFGFLVAQPVIEVIMTVRDVDGGDLQPGDVLEYTVIIKNLGSEPATNLSYRDGYPSNTSFKKISHNGCGGFQDVAYPPCFTNIVLSAGNDCVIKIQYTIDETIPENMIFISNQGVACNMGVCEPSDDPSTITDDDPTVIGTIDTAIEVEVYKTDLDLDGGLTYPGDVIEYTVTITNVGSETTGDLIYQDAISQYTNFQAVISCSHCFSSFIFDLLDVVCTDLAPGDACQIVYRVVINDPIPDNVEYISNQGMVSHFLGGPPFEPSDDPDTFIDDDPTITPVETYSDEDMDGFCDIDDNCPYVYNPAQEDCDSDGFGDMCDIDKIGLHYSAQLRGPQGLLRGADDGLDFPYFDFGWHCVGDTGCGELTITNGSVLDVIVAQVCAQCTVVAGSECVLFYIEQPAPRDMLLHPGESVTIGFCYDPHEELPAQGFRCDRCFDAAIAYRIPGDPRYQTSGVYLEGKRAEDGCFLGRMAGEQDFGSVRVGFSQEKILQIWNTGCRPLTVEAIASSVPEFMVLSPAFPLTVAEHSARDVVVRFDPHGVGKVEGVLTVVSNAQNRNVETGELIGDVEIAVRGVGIEAVLGDVTGDGELNLLDLLQLVNIVLGTLEPTAQQVWAADMDGNGVVNILDAIALVNAILTE